MRKRVTLTLPTEVTMCVCDNCGEENQVQGDDAVPTGWYFLLAYRQEAERASRYQVFKNGHDTLHYCPTCFEVASKSLPTKAGK